MASGTRLISVVGKKNCGKTTMVVALARAFAKSYLETIRAAAENKKFKKAFNKKNSPELIEKLLKKGVARNKIVVL